MSNVGQAALIVVGTVVGAYFGDAALGYELGSLAGSALFPTQLPAGPKISDNRTTTATLGGPIPIIFGTANVAGTVIWLAPYVEHKSEVSQKGGPQQLQYNYTQSIAILLAESPIDLQPAIGSVIRIWENGTIMFDVRPIRAANTLLGTSAETEDQYIDRLRASAIYQETFTLYLGTEDQLPDPTIEAVEGIGNVPAFRGRSYIVYHDRNLTVAEGLRHPNFMFEVSQAGTGDCQTVGHLSNEILYDWVDVREGNPVNPRNVMTYKFRDTDPNVPNTPPIGYSDVVYSNLGDAVGAAGAWYGVDVNQFMGYGVLSYEDPGNTQIHLARFPANPGVDTYPKAKTVQLHYNFLQPTYGDNWFDPGFNVFMPPPNPHGIPESLWWQPMHLTLTSEVSDGIDSAPPLAAPYTAQSRGGGHWFSTIGDAVIFAIRNPDKPPDVCEGLPPAPIAGYCVREDGRYIRSSGWVKVTGGNYKVLQALRLQSGAPNGYWYPLGPCLANTDPDYSNETFWTALYNTAVANGDMPSGWAYNATEGQVTNQYPWPQDWAWSEDLDICEGAGGPVSVAAIIEALCLRAGLTSIEVSDLTDIHVDGYAISSLSSAKDAIVPLRSVAFFDAVESGTTLRFQTRGKPVVATLTPDDFGAYDGGSGGAATVPPSLTTTRAQDVDLPRRIRLHYIAVSRDYQPSEQDSPFRLTTTAVNPVDVSIPVCMGDTQALQAADVMWSDAWASRSSHGLSVDQAWSELEPGDAIVVPVENFLQRMRIVNEKNSSGILRVLSCVRDNVDSYVSYRVAEPPMVKPPTLTLLAGTLVELLDLPALQDADNEAGFYLAAQRDPSSGNAWKGCTFYKSIDGGLTFTTLFSTVTEATLGALTAPIPASEPYTFDDVTEILVDVASSAFSFESRTDDAVLAGANAGAMGADGRWEVVQFAIAEQLSPTQWKLSRLLRGRRGTEYVMGTSVAGDTFVMLSTGAITRVVLSSAEIGANRVYKAVSIGATYSSGVDITFAGHAKALLPFCPVDAVATPQSDGDVLLSWTRRDRLGRTLMSGVDIPNSEASLAFEVDIVGASSPPAVIRTLSVSTTQALYTAAQIASDFGSTPPATIVVSIYQLSAVIGRGTPCTATLTL